MYEHVIAVTNRKLVQRDFAEQIRIVCKVHPKAIVLREKDLSEEAYRGLAQEVDEICQQYQVPLILHNFWKVAEALGKKQIQLPLPVLHELPESEMRKFDVIGTSVHSVEDAIEAVSLGADYLVAGHIFATDCKKGLPPRGLNFLREVCNSVSVPVYGIGGIHRDPVQIASVMDAGAAGVCIMSGMMEMGNTAD